jgi:hypothetical protein
MLFQQLVNKMSPPQACSKLKHLLARDDIHLRQESVKLHFCQGVLDTTRGGGGKNVLLIIVKCKI